MKLYKTKSMFVSGEGSDEAPFETKHFTEFTSSADGASKTRTRLKKLGHEAISSEEVEVDTTRTGLIAFLNGMLAEPTWVVAPVAEKLEG